MAKDATAPMVMGHCSDEEATRAIPAPLIAEVETKSYVIGREVRFYSDSNCSHAIDDLVFDLSNPDNKLPDVSHCAFYKVFDEGKTRSACLALTRSNDGQTSKLAVPEDACSDQRLIVSVSENNSMNGEMGAEINAALTKIISDLREAPNCRAVDLAHSIDAAPEVLASAEDLFWNTTLDEIKINLGFANSNSEFLADLEWINRNWDDQIAGVVLIVDGAQVAPTDMTDSAPAMKWKINETYRRVIDVSEAGNCDMFRDVLLFEDCVHAKTGEIAQYLETFLAEGLAQSTPQAIETEK